MIERLPTPWGLVRPRRRPRPPAAQDGLARVREDRGHRRLPLPRQRRGRPRRHATRSSRGSTTRSSTPSGADRPPARDPRRGPARLVAGHRVRRLVQRPPRLPGPRVRPLARAGGRDRQRQRRARRRPDARAHPGGARADRHDRRSDRGDRRRGRAGDPRPRPTRSRPGGLDTGRAGRARRPGRRRHPRRSGRARARPGERRRAGGRAADGEAQHRDLRSYASREPEGKPRAISLRFYTSPTALLGDEKVEAIEVVRNELVDGRAVADGRTARRFPAGSSSGASAIAARRSRVLPFDERSWTVPNDGGHVLGARRPPARRRLLRRLDQARPDGGDRHEQEGRDRDGRPPGRGRRRRSACARLPADEIDELLAARGVGVVTYAGWERIDAIERPRASRTVDRGSSSVTGTSSSTRRVSTPPPAELPRRRSCLRADDGVRHRSLSSRPLRTRQFRSVGSEPPDAGAPTVERLTRNRHQFRLTENGV